MPTVVKAKTEEPKENDSRKLETIKIYYQLVTKGNPPEQTRKDLGLSLQDIEHFDFSVFNKAV